jgi:hypothetical protein
MASAAGQRLAVGTPRINELRHRCKRSESYRRRSEYTADSCFFDRAPCQECVSRPRAATARLWRRPSDIATALKIGRASVYRVLGQA